MQTAAANNLQVKNPALAAEWHPVKNGELTPEHVTPGSGKKVWWQCVAGHEWESTVDNRSSGNGCPYCAGCRASATNNLQTKNPALAAEWHPTKNGELTPEHLTPGTGKKVWWQCAADHEWESSVTQRSKGSGCPYCAGCRASATNNLQATNPDLAAEWHPTKNDTLTPDEVTPGSDKKVWWQCPVGHEWESRVDHRSSGSGCPYCAGQRVSATNNLQVTNPALAAEWHPTKNGELTPEHLTPGTNKKVWWQCPAGHEWESRVDHRSKGSGCPHCAGQRVSATNNLQTKNPALAAEWHPTKNGTLTPDKVTAFCKKKVWWQCSAGHEWESRVGHRSSGRGCARCSGAWTAPALREFVEGMLPHLPQMTQAELVTICMQNGLLQSDVLRNRRAVQALLSRDEKELRELCSMDDSAASTTATTTENSAVDSILDAAVESIETTGEAKDHEAEITELPAIAAENALAAGGAVLRAVTSADEEAVEYLIAAGAARLWKAAYADADAVDAATAAPDEDIYRERVRKDFRDEFDESRALKIPAGWSSPVVPNLMQRHVAVQVRDRRRVGNWSGTGAGKTISAVLASRVTGSELTLVVCPNNTVSGWKKTILECYPDSRVSCKNLNPTWATGTGPRWMILNFEAFQQDDAGENLRKLVEREQISMIVIDEVHYAKQREERHESRRRENLRGLVGLAGEKSAELRVLAMSATPVVNNLFEARSLLELVEGVELADVSVQATVRNAIAVHQRLVRRGTRWMPTYQANLTTRLEEVSCDDVLDEVRALGRMPHAAQIEQALLPVKLPAIIEACKTGKILIYTEYVDGVVDDLRTTLEAEGLKVGIFTGGEKSGLERFLGYRIDPISQQKQALPAHEHVDVLIGSSAIGTGVDGLQHVCDRLVFATLPWTSAAFQQVVGRIHRQGQVSSKVEVVIPLTTATVGDGTWSWCQSRWDRIQYKRTLADAAVDGVVPEGDLVDQSRATRDAMAWLERLAGGDVMMIERPPLTIPLGGTQSEQQARIARYGEFSQMNAHWNTTSSQKTHERLRKDPEEWYQYHTFYRAARASWDVVPAIRLGEWLMDRPAGKRVADLGCGEMLIASVIGDRHEVLGFDHVAIDERVTACDIAHLPLEDGSVDVAICSLSLMGANRDEYLFEAHRILPVDGQLWIAETAEHLGADNERIRNALYDRGFDVASIERTEKFVLLRAIRSARPLSSTPTALFAEAWRRHERG